MDKLPTVKMLMDKLPTVKIAMDKLPTRQNVDFQSVTIKNLTKPNKAVSTGCVHLTPVGGF
jgi:hypothetical protein